MLDAFDPKSEDWFDTSAAEGDQSDEDDSPLIRCVACGHGLTSAAAGYTVRGRHHHRATNPVGIRFRFRTFSAAPGCRTCGAASDEHSWFPPLKWHIASCAGCGNHCGWVFAGDDTPRFVALIEDRFIEESRA